MYTKEDFSEAIKNAFLERELTANLYQAGDPRILQTLESQAQMLAMLSQQIELAMQEPFSKSRDATVLAEAALKGLIFTAKPASVVINAENSSGNAISLKIGRIFLDSVGRQYQLQENVIIDAYATAALPLKQLTLDEQTHTVTQAQPFYEVEITQPTDGSAISSLYVTVNDVAFQPSYKFNNPTTENIYHIDSDEYQRIKVKFGASGFVGKQLKKGDVIRIEKTLTFGDVIPTQGSPFSLKYLNSNNENNLKFSMTEMQESGVDPVDIATLRELIRYPLVYDKNAVFLGEFEMLLKRTQPNLPFLSVWNESREEKARGANVENINTLFISFVLDDNATTTRQAVENSLKNAIWNADDSYKVKFVDPVVEKAQCAIKATISQIFDFSEVEQKIKSILLTQFGKNGAITKRGQRIFKHKEIAEILVQNVQALNDSKADFTVTVANSSNDNPEVFRYMDASSITVTLTNSGYESNVWGGL